MQEHDSTEVENGTLFIHAYDVRVRVRDNHLYVSYVHFVDGLRQVKRFRLNRATAGLKRVIISGDSGFITFAALRWLEEVGSAFAQIGYDNQIHASFAPRGGDYPLIRRAQALACDTTLAVEIMARVLEKKLRGQRDVSGEIVRMVGKRLPTDDAFNLLEALYDSAVSAAAEPAEALEEMRVVESQVAAAYWKLWERVPVNFARREVEKVPEHWLTFGSRRSLLSGSNRKAANATNAMLNYLYSIARSETATALHAVGLDPGVGIMHADNPASDNLALDVMEAVRPHVDRWLLEFLTRRVFVFREFYEMEDGSVRMRGELRRELSAIGPACFEWAAPWAEYVRRELEKAARGRVTLGTPLTQENRKRGRNGYRVRDKGGGRVRVKILNRCEACGKEAERDNVYCSACWVERRDELAEELHESGIEELNRLQESGRFPAHTEEANRKRGETVADKHAERRAWLDQNTGNVSAERKQFREEIFPQLADVPVRAIARACGCSLGYASKIRSGKSTPHPRHNEALEQLLKDTS